MTLEHRRLHRPLRQPWQTAHARWTHRETLLLKAQCPQGSCFFAEIAPLPGFSGESLAKAEEVLQALHGQLPPEPRKHFDAEACPLTHGALEYLQLQASSALPHPQAMPTALLLPQGPSAPKILQSRAGEGYRVFKVKIGLQSLEQEWPWLETLAAALPAGGKLRLDANGSLGQGVIEKWIQRLAHLPLDYLEQPVAPGQEARITPLAAALGVPLAWDESACTATQIIQLAEMDNRATIVVKPLLIAQLQKFRQWRKTAPHVRCIYSSALESRIGLRLGMVLATEDPHTGPLGYGTGPLFEASLASWPETSHISPAWVSSEAQMAVWNFAEKPCPDTQARA